MDLWYHHQALVRAGISTGIVGSNLGTLHGINATAMMDRYPKARAVLTFRGGGDGQACMHNCQVCSRLECPPLLCPSSLYKFRAIVDSLVFVQPGA